MFLALEEDKALTSWPFVSEFARITTLKTFHCVGPTDFLKGGVYALAAEPLCKFSGLTEVHFGFGKIPNSWCYGPQIKVRPVSASLIVHAAMANSKGATGGLCTEESYEIRNRELRPLLNAQSISTHPETHEAAGLDVLKSRVKGKKICQETESLGAQN